MEWAVSARGADCDRHRYAEDESLTLYFTLELPTNHNLHTYPQNNICDNTQLIPGQTRKKTTRDSEPSETIQTLAHANRTSSCVCLPLCPVFLIERFVCTTAGTNQ